MFKSYLVSLVVPVDELIEPRVPRAGLVFHVYFELCFATAPVEEVRNCGKGGIFPFWFIMAVLTFFLR